MEIIHTHLEDPNMGRVNLNWMAESVSAWKKLLKLLICSEAQKLASDNVRMLKKISKLEIVQEKAPLRRGDVVIHVNTKDYRRLEEEIKEERTLISYILSRAREDVDYPMLVEWGAKLSVVCNACGIVSECLGFCTFCLKEGLKKGSAHAFEKFMLPKLDEVEEKIDVAQRVEGLKELLLRVERKVDKHLVEKIESKDGDSVVKGKGRKADDGTGDDVAKGQDKGGKDGGKDDGGSGNGKDNGGNGVMSNGGDGGKSSIMDIVTEYGVS